jgi:hypothetical protein
MYSVGETELIRRGKPPSSFLPAIIVVMFWPVSFILVGGIALFEFIVRKLKKSE